MQWLKPTEIESVRVLEARSPKSKCWQSYVPSESCKGESILVSFLPMGLLVVQAFSSG